MRYWSVQSLGALEKAKSVGYLEGDTDFIYEPFIKPYKWLMEQMGKRLRNYKGEYPVWMWTERPDLRKAGYLNKGEKGVLIELELDDKDVLISDFDAWHMVLMDDFLALSEKEYDGYTNGELITTKEESWTRVFDINLLRKYPDWWGDTRTLQATTGRVPMNKIKIIKELKCR